MSAPSRRAVLAALAALPFGLGAAAVAQERTARDALTARLRDGRVERTCLADGSAQALAIVDARFATTIARVLDFASYPTWLPAVRRCSVLSSAHGRRTLFVESAMPGGVTTRWAEVDVHIDGETDGAHAVSLRMLRGDFRVLRARLSLVATPGRVRTLLGVAMCVDPGVPLLGDASAPGVSELVRRLRASVRQ